MSQLDEYQINVYDFPNYDTEDKGDRLIPFAVVGSNVVVQVREGSTLWCDSHLSLSGREWQESEGQEVPLGDSQHRGQESL